MKRILLILTLVILVPAAMLSCSDALDAIDGNNVDADNHYNTFNDADNAILGIYGKMMNLADRVIVLNELRADLMDVTSNATFDQAAINNHAVNGSNYYCDMAPFYEVVLNCNDALANFDKMKAENKLSAADYGYRYSDVMTVRCWVYLQLAIHFGTIPYITDPLLTVDDVKDDARFPLKDFNEVLVALQQCMEAIPVKGLSIASPLYKSTNVDGNDMRLLFLNKNFVRGDIYLWLGDYPKAAACYYDLIADAEVSMFSGSENNCYKVDTWVWNASNEPRFQVCYERYKGTDLKAYRNKWKEIFSRAINNSELRREVITAFNYSYKFAPKYPLIELFANTGQGKYQLKPTKWAIDSMWEAQVQSENYFRFDGRGREASFDANVNGQPVIIKYLYDYYPQTIDANKTIHLQYNDQSKYYQLQGRWFIYRAGLLHLRYAEAVNRAGYPLLAYSLINGGVNSVYDWPLSTGSTRVDKEGVQYTSYPPADDAEKAVPYPYPYYLDARSNNSPYVYFRSPWRENSGIRGRAFLQRLPWPAGLSTRTDSIKWMEEVILNEAALECGFEGHRWGDMLRIAMRKNADGQPGTAFLNNKLQKAKPYVPYLTPDTWFLPKQ